jgi:hypothetical protein
MRRYAYGTMIETEPSRFLGEIPPELVETHCEIDRGFARSRQRVGPPPPRVKKPAPKGVHYEWDEGARAQNRSDFGELVDQDDFLAVGQWVRHPQWGRGQIVDREGHGEKLKLSIRFAAQTKRVAVAYAQLEPD